jgi:hypothetical protein
MWQHNPTISKYSEQNGHRNSSLISSSASFSSKPINISTFSQPHINKKNILAHINKHVKQINEIISATNLSYY